MTPIVHEIPHIVHRITRDTFIDDLNRPEIIIEQRPNGICPNQTVYRGRYPFPYLNNVVSLEDYRNGKDA